MRGCVLTLALTLSLWPTFISDMICIFYTSKIFLRLNFETATRRPLTTAHKQVGHHFLQYNDTVLVVVNNSVYCF